MTEDGEEQIGLWDTASATSVPPTPATPPTAPVLTLWTPNHDASSLQLCKTPGLLAISGKMGDVDVRFQHGKEAVGMPIIVAA